MAGIKGAVTPTAYNELLDTSRAIIAEGKVLDHNELSRRTGRSPASCKKVLDQGWRDRHGKQLPWAAPIRVVIDTEARAVARGTQITPAALEAAQGDPALAVAKKKIADLTADDIEGLSMLELLHGTSRASLTLGLKLGRVSSMLIDAVEEELARQLVKGELEVSKAVGILSRAAEAMRNTSALAKAAIDAELAIVGADPDAGKEAAAMTAEEAEEALERIQLVLRKRKARRHLEAVPDPEETPAEDTDGLDAPSPSD